MKSFREFIEARRNPEQNPKIKVIDILEPLKKDKDIYISFRNDLKLGINPSGEFLTKNTDRGSPFGMYFYPLYKVFNEIKKGSIAVAGNRKYIHVVRLTDKKIKRMSTITAGEVKRAAEIGWKLKLKNQPWNDNNFRHWVQDHRRSMTYMAVKKFDEFGSPKLTLKAAKTQWFKHWKTFGGSAGHAWALYNLTKSLASNLAGPYATGNSKETLAKWTGILRKGLGYSGLIDDIGGVFETERFQAVIFTTSSFKVLGAYENNLGIKDTKDLDD